MSTNRYLLVTWEGGGVIPPELGLARRLVARGHSVRVIADPTVASEAHRSGCGFTSWTTAPHVESLRPEDALIRDWDGKSVLKLLDEFMESFFAGPTPRYIADIEAEIDARPVDGIMLDFAMPAAWIVAEERRIPAAMIMPNCWIIPTPGIPPIGAGWKQSSNPAAKARDATVRALMTRLFNRGLPHFNAARTAHGLPPVRTTYEQMLGNRVLVLTSPVFDFTSPAIPPFVRYAGPILDDPGWAGEWQSPWSAGDARPLVVVGMSSTYQDQAGALQNVVDALSELPVRGLVTTGPALDADAVRPRRGPGDVVVMPSAPHAAVFPDASVLVTHCGHGTTMKGLAAGVPLVCMPMGRDQNDTAARVVQAGAGVRIKAKASPEMIRAAVKRVLDDGSYRAAAQRLAAAIASGQGCVDPVAELEAMVDARALP